jgi:hypothetical protein
VIIRAEIARICRSSSEHMTHTRAGLARTAWVRGPSAAIPGGDDASFFAGFGGSGSYLSSRPIYGVFRRSHLQRAASPGSTAPLKDDRDSHTGVQPWCPSRSRPNTAPITSAGSTSPIVFAIRRQGRYTLRQPSQLVTPEMTYALHESCTVMHRTCGRSMLCVRRRGRGTLGGRPAPRPGRESADSGIVMAGG